MSRFLARIVQSKVSFHPFVPLSRTMLGPCDRVIFANKILNLQAMGLYGVSVPYRQGLPS